MIFNITQAMAAELMNTSVDNLSADTKARSIRFMVKEKLVEVSTENMMAFLEGTDLKDEILEIGRAHV